MIGANSSDAFSWYALYVRSRQEKVVHAQLRTKATETFLPLYTTKHKWADRWKTVSIPLFPGYVFCRFDLASRGSILTTSGVIDVVRVGAEPAPIPSFEIEAVQSIVNSRLTAEPLAAFEVGEQVTLTEGPLKGLSGKLVEVRSQCRLVVSVELLQRAVSVEIDPEWALPYRLPVRQSLRPQFEPKFG